ncbi:MAG: hypothetical protein LBB18_03730 [Puniceicoccales bacterium]|jgi:hypothetical protein|nr:hypothetical protein [Puniceicoccales bacterium]
MEKLSYTKSNDAQINGKMLAECDSLISDSAGKMTGKTVEAAKLCAESTIDGSKSTIGVAKNAIEICKREVKDRGGLVVMLSLIPASLGKSALLGILKALEIALRAVSTVITLGVSVVYCIVKSIPNLVKSLISLVKKAEKAIEPVSIKDMVQHIIKSHNDTHDNKVDCKDDQSKCDTDSDKDENDKKLPKKDQEEINKLVKELCDKMDTEQANVKSNGEQIVKNSEEHIQHAVEPEQQANVESNGEQIVKNSEEHIQHAVEPEQQPVEDEQGNAVVKGKRIRRANVQRAQVVREYNTRARARKQNQ